MNDIIEADWHGLTVSAEVYDDGEMDAVQIHWPEGVPQEFREWYGPFHYDAIVDALTEAWKNDERRDGPEHTGEEDL